MIRGGGMMPMMGMMDQMSKMMENCNRMIQSNLEEPDSGPSQQRPSEPSAQGGDRG
jgi:hypothetical protein